jgi:hypothetical protein
MSIHFGLHIVNEYIVSGVLIFLVAEHEHRSALFSEPLCVAGTRTGTEVLLDRTCVIERSTYNDRFKCVFY